LVLSALPIYHRGNRAQYSSNRRLLGRRVRTLLEKSLFPVQNRSTIPR